LASPSLDFGYIKRELGLQRLSQISGWLWVAGRPMPPRPLHYQLLLSREIFVTERMDMHLVWTTGRIFLKPVSRFLLEPCFWSGCLCCTQDCFCSKDEEEAELRRANKEHGHLRLWKCALGFLFSYAALISHESDFLIAKDMHLIPSEVKWSGWRTFVGQVLSTVDTYEKIDARFIYGELRLSRLNKIYRLSQPPFLRGYMLHWQRYGTFFQENFALLASAIVYIAIILSAMQVGLATNSLADNDAFQSVSYGFAVFSILGPLVAAGLIVLAFCYMFVNNWIATADYRKKRLHWIRSRSEIF
jgi:hypothetical protein